jgi:hypothetical protein
MKGKAINLLTASLLIALLPGCTFLLGSKEDDTVDEIFVQGAIDPTLVPQNVGYVPIQPFFTGFIEPMDVYVGYDEMIYVVDKTGLVILDRTGTRHAVIPIPGATDVTQDRRLHTYVAGRVNINGMDLAAVYHLTNTVTGQGYEIIDTLIHPFADVSRKNTGLRGADDEKVQFTGLTTLFDNTLYVSRTGPVNDPSSIARPDNGVLFFNAKGENTGYSSGLNSSSSSLRSVLGISSIAGFAAPPQRQFGLSESRDFLITQSDQSKPVEFRVLWIKEHVDPDFGTTYEENTALVNFDNTKADRFLYDSFRFKNPVDVFAAPDASAYIFVVDEGLDSLYQFTPTGFEGVNPPANSGAKKQIRVSFGGEGSGPFQFKDPSGVTYSRKIVYVADKGNNRICRYILSTDLE